MNYAFPLIGEVNTNSDERFAVWNRGMTLRDYFAAAALSACESYHPEDIAKEVYAVADAMIKERDAKNEPVAQSGTVKTA
jgi:hypothetical protein